jgi:hypothetical protein
MPKGRFKLTLAGFTYGLILCAFSFIAAGYGHGTYTLMGLSSAPVCLFGVLPALLGCPLLWALIFALVGTGLKKLRWVFVAVMTLHYGVAVVVLTWPGGFYSNWDYISRFRGNYAFLTVFGFATYAAGQLFLWVRFARLYSAPIKNTR